jgi:hypothetical protein
MRRGDAKPRRAAQLTTSAGDEPLERAGWARARLARSAVPEPERKRSFRSATSSTTATAGGWRAPAVAGSRYELELS